MPLATQESGKSGRLPIKVRFVNAHQVGVGRLPEAVAVE